MPRRYADTHLGQMHLRVEGHGRPLLLLGSTGRSSHMFDRLIPLLAPHFQLVAPDLFGSGNSDPLSAGTSIEAIAQCMDEALTACGIARADVYGFHTGNKVAAALAASRPERVGRLVLAGQSHSLIPSNEKRNALIGSRTQNYFADRDGADPVARKLRAWATLQRNVAALWWPDALLDTAGDRRAALALARAQVLDELQCFDGIPALYRANFSYDFERDLRRIAAPTLVLEIETPAENSTLGAQAPAVCALVSGAIARTLQSEGFRLTLEQEAEEVAAVLLAFLANAGASQAPPHP